MHGDEKSDEGVVPEKRLNSGSLLPAEAVEGRTSPKGNGGRTAAARTRSRAAASNGLAAVRQAARQSKGVRRVAASPYCRASGAGLSRAKAQRCAWDRRGDMAGLWGKHRGESDRAARQDTPGQLPRPVTASTPEPKGGARCVGSARRDLRGRSGETRFPTLVQEAFKIWVRRGYGVGGEARNG
jgi:hypothetical protein